MGMNGRGVSRPVAGRRDRSDEALAKGTYPGPTEVFACVLTTRDRHQQVLGWPLHPRAGTRGPHEVRCSQRQGFAFLLAGSVGAPRAKLSAATTPRERGSRTERGRGASRPRRRHPLAWPPNRCRAGRGAGAEQVKLFETAVGHVLWMNASREGGLIQAAAGTFGGWGRRRRNRSGFAAYALSRA